MMAFAAMSLAFTSCDDEESFDTISEDDYPMIIDPIFPDRADDGKGDLQAIATISRDENFKLTITATPSAYTEITWLIDGEEVHKGDSIDIALEAGTYHLKVIATTTKGKSTYREAKVVVNPLEDDPWSEAVGFERIVSPGYTARLYGTNLDKVKGVVIDGQTVSDVTFGESESGSYIEYQVPANISDGEYRISLVDADGERYGANKVTVSNSPVMTSGFTRAGAGKEMTMTGLGLDKVSALTMGGETVQIVSQSATELVAVCPELPDGEYTLKGTDKNGGEVLFYVNGEMVAEAQIAISPEAVLWTGHQSVDWNLPDSDPNKTFNKIPTETFASMRAGSILRIYYSIKQDAEYHQMRTTTAAWNDLPGTTTVDLSEDGVVEVTLTQEALDMIVAEGGFLCVGYGYYVDMVTVE